MRLSGKTALVGITGGIAAYKACSLVSSLKKQGANVHVAMTKHAREFITPLTLETLSGNRVVSDMFDRDFTWEVEHVSLAKKSDICIIAPCTANFAAKLANGIADDFLSTTVMACTCPILIAPAMNTKMLNSKAYRDNEKILTLRGVHFISSGCGKLACGDVGDGRMAEPNEITSAAIDLIFPKQDLGGKTVLVTAGGTIEPIDPVRYIGNHSSGKMGLALAKAAAERGAKVIVVKARTSVDFSDSRFEVISAVTTQEMLSAVMANYKRADIIIKAAAPCDYSAAVIEKNKIKSDKLTLNLKKTVDIAAEVGKVKGERKLIIFAAETENVKANAADKLKRKNADMVVANDVTKSGSGFDSDTNIVSIITKNSSIDLPMLTKREVADSIFDALLTKIDLK